jgi:hypothetical protein
MTAKVVLTIIPTPALMPVLGKFPKQLDPTVIWRGGGLSCPIKQMRDGSESDVEIALPQMENLRLVNHSHVGGCFLPILVIGALSPHLIYYCLAFV